MMRVTTLALILTLCGFFGCVDSTQEPSEASAIGPQNSLLRSVRERAAERLAGTVQPQTKGCGEDPSCDTSDGGTSQAGPQRDLAEFETPNQQGPTSIPVLGPSGRALLILMLMGVAYRTIR